jgi:ParB family chromosome partitioning protein
MRKRVGRCAATCSRKPTTACSSRTSPYSKLVAKKLEKLAAKVQAEGWKWVEIRSSFDRSEWSQYGRRYQELSSALEAELEALTNERDDLWNADTDDEDPRLVEIDARIEEIDDEKHWTPETLSVAGAIVTIDYDGKAAIERGYVKPDDMPRRNSRNKAAAADNNGAETDGEQPFALSAILVEYLTTHRTAAIAAELLTRPDIALAALVHTLAAQLFLNSGFEDTCLALRVTRHYPRDIEGAKACAVLDMAEENWASRIPGTSDALWIWCLEKDRETILDLLA